MCRRGFLGPLLSHQTSGPWGRALSQRPSALRPRLLPRCCVPSVAFLDLVNLGFKQGERLGSLGTERRYCCHVWAGGGTPPWQPSLLGTLQAAFLSPALSTPVSFLPAPPLAHAWRLDTNATTSRSGLESASLCWGQSRDLGCSHLTQSMGSTELLWTEAEPENRAVLSHCIQYCDGGLCHQPAPSRVAGTNQGGLQVQSPHLGAKNVT